MKLSKRASPEEASSRPGTGEEEPLWKGGIVGGDADEEGAPLEDGGGAKEQGLAVGNRRSRAEGRG